MENLYSITYHKIDKSIDQAINELPKTQNPEEKLKSKRNVRIPAYKRITFANSIDNQVLRRIMDITGKQKDSNDNIVPEKNPVDKYPYLFKYMIFGNLYDGNI